MLISLIVTSFNDFPRMRFILLFGSVCEQSDVVMDIEIEQRPRFSSCFIDNEVIERIMLPNVHQQAKNKLKCITYMRYNDVFLDGIEQGDNN